MFFLCVENQALLDSVDERNCLKTEKVKDFPQKNSSGNEVNTRKKKKYEVNLIRTERYKKSAIPYI